MNKPKIIFILSSTSAQRCIKRIDEFIENNFEIEAYGFSRGTPVFCNSNSFRIKIIGEFSNSTNYFRRIFFILKKIKGIINKYKGDNVIFYFFGFDTALISLLMPVKYFYEEPDLVHTYIKLKPIKFILDKLDKKIIKNSFETIFTSEGFQRYHFGIRQIKNISIIPNRLNKSIDTKIAFHKKATDINNIKIGFVGSIRFESVINFAKVMISSFPTHEIHFFGTIDRTVKKQVEQLRMYPNVYYHGPFTNPNDLPMIYKKIDLLLSTYDAKFQNVQYAEPNKLYESIFFRTPIIVSSGTFLSEKVSELGIGYSVDPLMENEIIKLINDISSQSINKRLRNLNKIPKEHAINSNADFFEKINNKIN